MKVFFITKEGNNIRVLFRVPLFRYFICWNYTLRCFVYAVKYWDGHKYKWREV